MSNTESLKKRNIRASISKFGRTQNLGEVAPPPLELLDLGYSADEEKAAYTAFVEKYPDFPALDSLRASDYGQLDSRVDLETGLDKLPEIYLDYTGAMQTGRSHVYKATELVTGLPLGNPHSSSQTSSLATKWVQRAEQAVLAHMNTDSNEYYVIWTPNASGACRLVAEWFDFGPPGSGAACAICQDNHNSVHGIREEAILKGAEVVYTPIKPDTLHMDSDATARVLSGDFSAAGCRTGAKPPGALGCLAGATGQRGGTGKKLFAYPLQSNVSGVKHNLDWIQYAHERDWLVFADAAAFMPTNFLDLSKVKPDFVSMSFYKIFGHPTGVGALLVRHEAAQHLVRKKGWFAGGTIAFNSAMGFGANRHLAHEMAPGKDKFEEGTVNFSNFLGVYTGLEYMRKINETGHLFRKLVGVDVEEVEPHNTGNDMVAVQRRVRQLTDYLLSELSEIKYPFSEQPLVKIYGRSLLDDHKRGGTIPLNVMTASGQTCGTAWWKSWPTSTTFPSELVAFAILACTKPILKWGSLTTRRCSKKCRRSCGRWTPRTRSGR